MLKQGNLGKLVKYLIMLLISIVMVFPFYWMAVSSLKTPEELSALPPVWWPESLSFDSFKNIFEVIPFGSAMVNSIIVTTAATVSILITSIMAGYVFAKYQFRGKNILFVIVLSTMMVPQFVLIVPLYHMMNGLNLVNTFMGLILPNMANAFGIFLMKQFIEGIPDDLIEAARLDGASEWKILWKVIVPLLKPAASALILFAFVFQWNNFLWPLTIVQTPEMNTVVLALNSLRSYTTSVEYTNVVMAGAVIGILPSVFLFLWLQKFFIEGIAMTGIKG
ncbi:carbohydrate ABC transporter permease [Neobacillus drentensis]|uniref:carbohydrate ABC transporter permease n=1 Tax=Neobacillus drentensis TaxID=220684 RepID=UPI00285AAA48|nr:carbohydrate ABC transporter permease [Neobacillus drentensis]MDR7238861.1 multiple sugar transport system permease protein [Neobacillus drentensis]